eukprot:TRINITY_DN2900_c0_g5_i1.p1 TRINITY_DN2900_c0_g5~~TRINITY_DN2900_c0_g5_i1.p1  ORF type:complete len:128 (+),score=3.62 TRINITY_DN2900_c0_g5_i1:41-424(+)
MSDQKHEQKPHNPFDIHVYFDNDSKEFALKLRTELKEKFPWLRFMPVKFERIGPHPLPMWEADFYNYKNLDTEYGQVMQWLQLNHGSLTVLIHPNTGYPRKDHTENAYWLGKQLSLYTSYLPEISKR